MNKNSEEMDKILISNLKSTNIEFSDIKSMKEIDKNDLFRLSSNLTKSIYESDKVEITEEFTDELPQDTAQCFRVCTNLSNSIISLGYKLELGFDNFLYPNENSSRNLLSFLIDKSTSLFDVEDDKKEISQ